MVAGHKKEMERPTSLVIGTKFHFFSVPAGCSAVLHCLVMSLTQALELRLQLSNGTLYRACYRHENLPIFANRMRAKAKGKSVSIEGDFQEFSFFSMKCERTVTNGVNPLS